jgi:asparaginyl-tRNA synthetase
LFYCEAFLTISDQLNIQTYCLALSKVYTFGLTIRAENSNTSRHRAEFWIIDLEIAFADLLGNEALAEALLVHLRGATERREEDLAFFDERIARGWPRNSK